MYRDRNSKTVNSRPQGTQANYANDTELQSYESFWGDEAFVATRDDRLDPILKIRW